MKSKLNGKWTVSWLNSKRMIIAMLDLCHKTFLLFKRFKGGTVMNLS